jgi:hypothetical protein
VDYEEHGPMGFQITPSTTLAELRKLRQMYVDALNDPTQWDEDPSYLISEFDNPGL